jgi:hypothetical protein
LSESVIVASVPPVCLVRTRVEVVLDLVAGYVLPLSV